jgi:hypothetical protein
MNYQSPFWKKHVFSIVLVGCGLFVVMTLLAMVFYPGGTYMDPNTKGYSFFQNFFSELGLRTTHLGGQKMVSLALFAPALVMVGAGLILFFLAFPQFFQKTRTGRILSGAGTVLGILSGICLMGVVVPADINMAVHKSFVIWAFRLFPAAVMCYMIVMLGDKEHPKGYAWELAAFFILLVGYMLLLEFGPEITTQAGVVIQAAGQKVIVYASIISIMIQAGGARQRNLIALKA